MQNSYIENLVGNGKVSLKSTIPYNDKIAKNILILKHWPFGAEKTIFII